jgi:hypothetical protein
MQQTFPCPKCGSHNVIGEPSCLACGESFKYTCPQCGVIVDTKLKACSNCGATLDWPIHHKVEPSRVARGASYQGPDMIGEERIPKQKRRSPIVIGGLVVVAVSLLAGLATYILSQEVPSAPPPGASPPVSEATPATAEAIEITAEELLQAYRADEKAAEAEYEGKILKVTGVVSSAGKNMVGIPFVKLAGSGIEAWRVRCMFGKEYELSEVTTGQTVTIQGECDDYLSPDVIMKECVLVN